MRVTFLTPSYIWVPSGGIRVIYEYANQLVAKGHEVTVIHPRRLKYIDRPAELDSLYYRVRKRAVEVVEMFYKPSLRWQTIDSRVRQLYVPTTDASYIPDADAIFATAYPTVSSVLEYPRIKGEKFYLLQHYETFMGSKDSVDATWRAPLHKVVVSKWLVEVGKQLGCTNISYIPNALDHSCYRLLKPIERRPARVAMLFSKASIKGAADGISAIEMVRAKYPFVKVVFFGATNIRPIIPAWIEYHCNPPQEFIVENIYNGSSIFLSSSWSEGFALPPAEAAACGCAIVATDSGGIRDYIENGVTGLLSQPKDPKSLADNLCYLLENEEVRLQLALAANRRVMELRWEESAARLEDLILKVLEKGDLVPAASSEKS